LGATPPCVRRRLRRIAIAALIAAVVIALFAGALTETAKAGFLSDTASRLFGRSKTLDLAPIVGAPPNVGKVLAQWLVSAGKDNKLTITPDGTGSSYVLKGYLIATNERKGAKVSYILDINDSKGQRVGRVSGEQLISGRAGADPWSGVTTEDVRSLAAKMASQISSALSGGSTAPPPVASDPLPAPGAAPSASARAPTATATVPAPRVVKGPVTAMVSPVTGAPGDGMKSLTAAIKKRLYAKGVKLTSIQSENTYTVKGVVSLIDASGGKQSIRIEWQVLDPNGKKVGTVSQQNNIPKGSLNGPWGAVADAAAGAAADGIVKLLPKSG
jgi:hypothetical protein